MNKVVQNIVFSTSLYFRQKGLESYAVFFFGLGKHFGAHFGTQNIWQTQ